MAFWTGFGDSEAASSSFCILYSLFGHRRYGVWRASTYPAELLRSRCQRRMVSTDREWHLDWNSTYSTADFGRRDKPRYIGYGLRAQQLGPDHGFQLQETDLSGFHGPNLVHFLDFAIALVP